MTDEIEWIPEVGEECEFRELGGYGDVGWHRCRVLTHDGGRVVVGSLEGFRPFFCRIVPLTDRDLRPIKSKEDLEREATIQLLENELAMVDAIPARSCTTYAEALYDAGYRKPREDCYLPLVDKQAVEEVIQSYMLSDTSYDHIFVEEEAEILGKFLMENFTITRKVKS